MERIGKLGVIGALSMISPLAAATPKVVAAYAGALKLTDVAFVKTHPTQMAWGADGRLYIASDAGMVLSYAYDPSSGTLSNLKTAVTGISCLGIGFQGATMYLSSTNGSIYRLRDENKNGVYGQAKETRVAIVTGIPQGDHNLDNIQIKGDTLFVGVGLRTINGRTGEWTSGSNDDYGGSGFWSGGIGKTWGDSAYGGTICWIQDLTKVPDRAGAANVYVGPGIDQDRVQNDGTPYKAAKDKLVVHSAGARNPFGLALDQNGNLYFTNNFNRTNTNGDGTAGFGLHGDVFDSDFSDDTYDQFFRASRGADYGYTNENWRGAAPILTPGTVGYHRVRSITYDQLFNPGPYTIYNPAQPKGLGPSSSSDGVAFFYSDLLPAELQGNAFIARYNGSITEAPGKAQRTLTYGDLVAVNPATGRVRRIAVGFNHALAVLADGHGRLLVADHDFVRGDVNGGKIYSISAR